MKFSSHCGTVLWYAEYKCHWVKTVTDTWQCTLHHINVTLCYNVTYVSPLQSYQHNIRCHYICLRYIKMLLAQQDWIGILDMLRNCCKISTKHVLFMQNVLSPMLITCDLKWRKTANRLKHKLAFYTTTSAEMECHRRGWQPDRNGFLSWISEVFHFLFWK